MDIKRNADGDLIEIDGKVRVQKTHRRLTATATEELLSDTVTAKHYAVGLRDARGKVIELGAPFEYVDWKGPMVFGVYQLQAVPDELNGEKITVDRFMPKGEFETEELALGHAMSLLA